MPHSRFAGHKYSTEALNLHNYCKSIGCTQQTDGTGDFCTPCQNKEDITSSPQSLANRYPDYYRSVGDMTEIDVFAVHHLFRIDDHSGCLQQASQKLLLSGVSKTLYADVKGARDMLTRWLQLNQERNTP